MTDDIAPAAGSGVPLGPPAPGRHAPSSDWPRRLIAAAVVITGIFRMSAKQHMTWFDTALVVVGCTALGFAGLQEARRVVKERRTRSRTT
ncbi:hypothetical protein ACFYXS_33965 [Streptomyces sp. NPDC002574]|uniref:hypothetical protein n=1 Tax=Streptomyces sp. NPDC002574 TaxID=3364652 RepID=UPI0036BFEB83